MKRIGIDLGGTKTEIILTTDDPFEVLHRKRVPTSQEKGYHFIIEQLANLIIEFRDLASDKTVVGMGIPGSINVKTGLVRNSNTQCLIGKRLKVDLEKKVNQAVWVENDANCFALSEARAGAGKGHKVVLGVIMGTGMGGGIVYNGELWSGLQGIAAEWGHTTIDIHGPLCWCGQRGCLEMYLSGTGISRMYKEKTGSVKSAEEIFSLFERQTDSNATEVIEEFLYYFGRGMANLINTIDPNLIVIGGGVSNLAILYDKGIEQTKNQLFNTELDTPIVKNCLGDSSGIFGAAILADNLQ